jgi:pimeloyl-ACP methyl ester carboxylesterase
VELITRENGVTVSYERYGAGPPLVLVHGGFSDHATNWQEARPALAERFTVYAVARRGRGQTTATQGHSVLDEAADVQAVLQRVAQDAGEPAALLGHSYGGVCALEAARIEPVLVNQLVLYEPPNPREVTPDHVRALERLALRGDWDGLVQVFLVDVLQVPPNDVRELRDSPGWQMWTDDAPASVHDLRALIGHRFEAHVYRGLTMPTLLLIGTESPRDLYLTDALASVLPDVRIGELAGQGHEGMTTAPAQFVEAISRFLRP